MPRATSLPSATRTSITLGAKASPARQRGQEPELEIAGGQVERWRIVNAANTKYVRLSIGERPFSIIGTDRGLLTEPREATEVLVTPGERVELAVGPFDEGEQIEIEALPYEGGRVNRSGRGLRPVRVGAAAPSRVTPPGASAQIEPLASADAEPTRTIDMKALMHGGHHQRDEPVRVGELQVWELVNETGSDHPFHLHGFFFQVIDVDGEPPPVVSWEDTVNVPKRAAADRVAPRRSSRRVDVPLPHPRAPRDGDDGSLRSRSLNLFEYRRSDGRVRLKELRRRGDRRGQAGLVIGYFLAHQERRFLIVDAADSVGSAWRRRWDVTSPVHCPPLQQPSRTCFSGRSQRLPDAR